jgi:hypothetical protein
MSDMKKLADLENELRELISASAHRTLMTVAAIEIELEDYGSIRTKPPQESPEVWDPDGKIRHVYTQITAVRKRIDAEKS